MNDDDEITLDSEATSAADGDRLAELCRRVPRSNRPLADLLRVTSSAIHDGDGQHDRDEEVTLPASPASRTHGSPTVRLVTAVADVGGVSRRGTGRRRNEDAWGANDGEVFVVADGMGGRRGGDVAAETAVDSLLAGLARRMTDWRTPLRVASFAVMRATSSITSEKNRPGGSADDASAPVPGGAAIVALRCVDDRTSIIHVGDARAYRIRGGAVEPLTRDHCVGEVIADLGVAPGCSGLAHRQLRALTGFLGGRNSWEDFAVRELTVESGDRIVLCSDGCYGRIDHEGWERVSRIDRATRAASYLVERAARAGAHDDATAVVVDLDVVPAGRASDTAGVLCALAAAARGDDERERAADVGDPTPPARPIEASEATRAPSVVGRSSIGSERSAHESDDGMRRDPPLTTARRCHDAHLNPPHRLTCRRCGRPIDPDVGVITVEQPSLAIAVLNDGTEVELSGSVVFGRRPRDEIAQLGTPQWTHRLDAAPSVSRTHLAVVTDGWSLTAVDCGSRAGSTIVTALHPEPITLEPWTPHEISGGDVLHLGRSTPTTITIREVGS